MTPRIANNDMGACAGCGVGIDAGEWYIPRAGGATHVGCTPRPRTVPKGEAQSSMFLFDDQPREIIETAKTTIGITRLHFDGVSALPLDTPRLAKQFAAIFTLMRDGQYRTLSKIAETVGALETSCYARLADCRKASHTVELRRVNGVNEYRLILNEKGIENERRVA